MQTGGITMFEIMFGLVFFLVIGMFIATAVRGIVEWTSNNNSPRLTVPAEIVGKRAHTSRHHHNNNGHHHTTHTTTYYVTFQVESGDRMELKMTGREYGMFVEGDTGMLSFQGTQYLGFERNT